MRNGSLSSSAISGTKYVQAAGRLRAKIANSLLRSMNAPSLRLRPALVETKVLAVGFDAKLGKALPACVAVVHLPRIR